MTVILTCFHGRYMEVRAELAATSGLKRPCLQQATSPPPSKETFSKEQASNHGLVAQRAFLQEIVKKVERKETEKD